MFSPAATVVRYDTSEDFPADRAEFIEALKDFFARTGHEATYVTLPRHTLARLRAWADGLPVTWPPAKVFGCEVYGDAPYFCVGYRETEKNNGTGPRSD